jgi:DNA repair protein RecO (recombination protein O)
MARLEQAVLVRPFLALRESPARFALASYLLEMFDRAAPEGGPRQDTLRLFQFAIAAQRTIEVSQPDALLRTLLELRSLDALGLRPELLACVRCGGQQLGPAAIGFHIGEGGSVCSRCEGNGQGLVRVHLGTLRALEQALRLDLAQLGRLKLSSGAVAEASQLVHRFQRFHLGVELRSERFLNEILLAPRLTPAEA